MKNKASKIYWTAFYVKSRAEMTTSNRLSKRGFTVFCPSVEEIRQWKDRKKKIRTPLFKGYLFARVNEKERIDILQDSGIVSSVIWMGVPAIIREEEIEAINLLIGKSGSGQVNLEDYKSFSSGDFVEINAGAFTGKKGLLLDVKRNKVVVRIETIQAQLSIDNIHKLITT